MKPLASISWLVGLLLWSGEDAAVRNKDRLTSLELARKWGH